MRANSNFQLPLAAIESGLHDQRERLPLAIPCIMALGICFWELHWQGQCWLVLSLSAALLLTGLVLPSGGRLRRVFIIIGFAFALGFSAITLRSASVADAPLGKIEIRSFYAEILAVEKMAARDAVRLTLATGGHAGLPKKIRVNLRTEQYVHVFSIGATIRLRARLMPPAPPSLPSGYDFARRAWFSGIGATGTALGDVVLHQASQRGFSLAQSRDVVSEEIKQSLDQRSGPLASALLVGDGRSLSQEQIDDLRSSGLAHLISVSGLHVTAVVGGAFLLVIRVLALIPWLALRVRLPLVAAATGAIVAIGYTLFTGAEIPTIRSCIAALVVLVAMAMGRDPLTMRAIATGALIIMIFVPEAVVGPSFQLSFAAITTIVALIETKFWQSRILTKPEDGVMRRMAKGLAGLLIMGLAIEFVIAPIALFHFHRAGLYGAFANILAIPLTTFVVMPSTLLGLAFDLVGAGKPFWYVAQTGATFILDLAHGVAAAPGAQLVRPAMPLWAFWCMLTPLLVIAIFPVKRAKWLLGFYLIGALGLATAPRADLLVTGDGKHLAVIDGQGRLALLRSGAGDFVKRSLSESAGIDIEPIEIEDWPGTQCNADSCIVTIVNGARSWTLLASRSGHFVPTLEMVAACSRVDILVSDRWLPSKCQPRWLKLDRRMLEKTGGVAIRLADQNVTTVQSQSGTSPWAIAAAAMKEDAERKSLRQSPSIKPVARAAPQYEKARQAKAL